jgi:hypothetical protein
MAVGDERALPLGGVLRPEEQQQMSDYVPGC